MERLGARTEGCTAHTTNPTLQRDHTRPLLALKICTCYAGTAARRVPHKHVSNVQQEALRSAWCWLPFSSSQLFTLLHIYPSRTLKLLSVLQKRWNFSGVTAGTKTVGASFDELVIISKTKLPLKQHEFQPIHHCGSPI